MNGNWDKRISRRTLLRTGGAAAVVLYGSAIPSASAEPRFADYPFKLGVASGEPTQDGIVLWTRLAPDPLNGGGLGDASYLVRFEVAKDPSFLDIVHRGHTRVGPEEVHTVHAEVGGLKREREYWYRFECKG
jgi:alkaline phosphatase D